MSKKPVPCVAYMDGNRLVVLVDASDMYDAHTEIESQYVAVRDAKGSTPIHFWNEEVVISTAVKTRYVSKLTSTLISATEEPDVTK